MPSLSQLLASTRQEAQRITAELDRKAEIYSQRPRRKHISARTQEYKYAAYLEAWRRKVERIGNLNYPDDAKRHKLYGHLVLTVTLSPDGTVDGIRLLRSSGHKLLDDAAIRIVRLAAPYAPFPKEIRAETDLLEITRTWQFLSSNRLFSEN
jgi:protein TonB